MKWIELDNGKVYATTTSEGGVCTFEQGKYRQLIKHACTPEFGNVGEFMEYILST